MESLSHVPPIQPPSDPLHEHLELSHYIDTFRVSAERVRRLLFIIAAFSVVVLAAFWNTTPWSWGSARNHGYKALLKLPIKEFDKKVQGAISRDDLAKRFEEYDKLRTKRVMFPQIPIIGVTFDVNDLGNFCGWAYLLLLPLLLFSLMREHDHLYLALFKVRRLHDDKRHGSGGESRANYLYHALAMSQVLHSPPTLAQWRPSRVKRWAVPSSLFLFPIVIELYIVYRNWATVDKVAILGVPHSVLYPEIVFAALNLGFCFMCCRYSMDFNHMWETAFFHINPTYEFVARRPSPRALPWPSPKRTHTQKRLRSQAISALEVVVPKNTDVPLVYKVNVKDGKMISNAEIDEMCTQLERAAEEQGKIVDSRVTSSNLRGRTWEVKASFDLCDVAPRRRRGSFLIAMLLPRRPEAAIAPAGMPLFPGAPAGGDGAEIEIGPSWPRDGDGGNGGGNGDGDSTGVPAGH